MPKMGLDETSTRINLAVRAEAARFGFTGKDVADALRRDKKYVYDRYKMLKPFALSDLKPIAALLGIEVQDIFDSAEFGRKLSEKRAA